MPNGSPVHAYVINGSSLLAAAEAGDATLNRLVALAVAQRLCTVSMVIKFCNEDRINAAFAACLDHFVIKEPTIYVSMQEVTGRCGDSILSRDPTLEDHEPWILSLALARTATIVSEESRLSKIRRGAAILMLPVLTLSEMLALEA